MQAGDAFRFGDSPLLDAALHAATHMLIPVAPHPRSAQALELTLEHLHLAARLLTPPAHLGVLRTRIDAHAAATDGSAAGGYGRLIEDYEELLLRTIVYSCPDTGTSRERGLPVQAFAPLSRGAEQFGVVTDEVLARLGAPPRLRLRNPWRREVVSHLLDHSFDTGE